MVLVLNAKGKGVSGFRLSFDQRFDQPAFNFAFLLKIGQDSSFNFLFQIGQSKLKIVAILEQRVESHGPTHWRRSQQNLPWQAIHGRQFMQAFMH
jgi:hypothetical protein